VLAASAAILLFGTVFYLFRPQPVSVDLVSATRGPMSVTVLSEGKTRVADHYEVVAPLGGRLLRVAIKAGDVVVANRTLIAAIEPPQPQFNDIRSRASLEAKVHAAEALYALAEAEIEHAQARHTFALADLIRSRSLTARGATSARSLEQAELEVKTQRAALNVAEKTRVQRQYELESANAALIDPSATTGASGQTCIEVRSPVDGRVLNVLRESETIVAPGMALVEIGDPARLEVVLEMLSEDAVKVREGAAAALEGWGGERLQARVQRIEPFGYTKISALGIEEQRVRVRLDFLDPPQAWRSLGHGYRVSARIVTWEKADVTRVAAGALFREGNRWAVYTVVNSAAQMRHVVVGHMNGLEAEVLEGLSPGNQVILHPSDRISTGVPVTARPSQ
jgi:HlyD family secretion protein